MPQHVAFLRAVNVGKRRVEMDRLATVLAGAGLDDVWTSINSGNAIFRSPKRAATLEPLVERVVSDEWGFVAEAFVRTSTEVVALSERAPFGDLPEGHTHMVALLRSVPDTATVTAIEALSGPVDDLIVIGSEVHWHIAGKSLDSELKPKDWKAAGVGLTTSRNITMLRRLAPKLDA